MFWKSSRGLTPRKRFVLWGGVFLVLLVSVLTIILLANQKKKGFSGTFTKRTVNFNPSQNSGNFSDSKFDK